MDSTTSKQKKIEMNGMLLSRKNFHKMKHREMLEIRTMK